MSYRGLYALATGVLIAAGVGVAAQDAPALPKVLRIYREEIKQGKDSAHMKLEAAYVKLATKYKYPVNFIGLNVVAGPSEAWYVEAHDSFLSVENTDQAIDKNVAMRTDIMNWDALDGELRGNSRTLLLMLRPELCYQGDKFMTALPKTRYMEIVALRVRPGMDLRFAEIAKNVIAADQKAMLEQPVAVYQLVSGGMSGTYFLFVPTHSLKSLDEGPEREDAMMKAMGMENAMSLLKQVGETIASEESYLFSINPKTSYVSKDFAAADPEFWNPKPVSAKPAGVKPAAKEGPAQ